MIGHDLRTLTAHDAQLIGVDHVQRVDGTGAGERLLAVSPSAGVHAHVLLDRGLDLGRAWHAGEPVSWTSAAGPRRAAASTLDDDGWHRGWGGGFLTTCGLRNVGGPSGDQPRHGRYTENGVERLSVTTSPDAARVAVSGEIRENDGIGRLFVLRRTWTFHSGVGRIDLRDELLNESSSPAAFAMLYHVNVGYPFLQPTSELSVDGRSYGAMGEPGPEADEVLVLDHDDLEQPRTHDGWRQATLTDPHRGRTLTIAWNDETLPKAYSWRRRTPGAYVQAVEPATWGISGLDDSHPLPILEPGESRTMAMTLMIEEDA